MGTLSLPAKFQLSSSSQLGVMDVHLMRLTYLANVKIKIAISPS